jgi:hypothetical protein
MPHLADDKYHRQFATYVNDTLRPDVKVYVEWSNEVWHTGFAGEMISVCVCEGVCASVRVAKSWGHAGGRGDVPPFDELVHCLTGGRALFVSKAAGRKSL